jgi:Holliday junction resolvase RusA-like endonuclease
VPREVRFDVPGKPRGKQRPRSAPGHSRPYTPKQTVQAEKAIAALYRVAAPGTRPLTGNVRLDVEAVFRIPKSFKGDLLLAAYAGEVPYTGKPDKDNIEKLVMDALNGLAWVDDAQIVAGEPTKRYGHPERVTVTITELESVDAASLRAKAKREAALANPRPAKPRGARSSKQTKSKLPAALQAAVDKALARMGQ